MTIITRDKCKTYLGITTTTYDDMIDLLIPQVEADFLIVRGIAFDEDSNDVIEYPGNAELIASQMIGYLLKTTGFNAGMYSDKKSESIGSYSYTRNTTEDQILGYPKLIVGRIERWMNPKL